MIMEPVLGGRWKTVAAGKITYNYNNGGKL
jgi:hypothetical protein